MNNAIATVNRSVLMTLTLLLASTTLSLLAEPEADRKADNKSSNAGSHDSYMGLSGEELWSNNCMRCHNIRPPTMHSDAQWDVIVHHMRLRANITGQEQRAIVEFLKSAK
jgi:cytochrome c5